MAVNDKPLETGYSLKLQKIQAFGMACLPGVISITWWGRAVEIGTAGMVLRPAPWCNPDLL